MRTGKSLCLFVLMVVTAAVSALRRSAQTR